MNEGAIGNGNVSTTFDHDLGIFQIGRVDVGIQVVLEYLIQGIFKRAKVDTFCIRLKLGSQGHVSPDRNNSII